MPPRAVRRTVEFERVAALPRRTLNRADAEAWAAVFTSELLLPGAQGALRPWQGQALAEAIDNRGGLFALPVGQGKTLVTYALPALLGSKRPLLIVPGVGLQEKTLSDFATLRKTWRGGEIPPQVITLQNLAPESGAHLLDAYDPDLIMIDECDELANGESSAAGRLDRFRVKRSRDECVFVCLTGTLSRNSIMGYWHLLCWCLLDDAPVPLIESEARMWAWALDNQTRTRPIHPGPLGASREEARAWYCARLAETPGVMLIDEDSAADVPLVIKTRLARECREIDGYYESFLRQGDDVPDGLVATDGLSRWRLDGQLGCGYFLRYVPPGPPLEWRLARRLEAAFIRNAIKKSRATSRPLDTCAQVRKRFPDAEPIETWRRVEKTYTPMTEPVWISRAGIDSVRDWLAESKEPSIVFCGGVEFAEALALETRLPYYGARGQDANTGRYLHDADPTRSAIVSWHSGKRGYNLQAWRRILIVHPPQSAKYLEQIFGRVHRAGQKQSVEITLLVTSGGTLDAFEKSLSEAGFARSTVGMTQKILRAELDLCAEPELTRSNRFRWARRGAYALESLGAP